MRKEQLLKQAAFLYPVGTIFDNSNIVTTGNRNKSSNGIPFDGASGNININRYDGNMTIYHKYLDKWATVKSRPEQYIKVIDTGMNCSLHSMGKEYDNFIGKLEKKVYKVISRRIHKEQLLFILSNNTSTCVVSINENLGKEYYIESSEEEFKNAWPPLADDVELEEGVWYTYALNGSTNRKWIVKYKRISGPYVYGDMVCMEGSDYFYKGGHNDFNPSSFKKATPVELNRYLKKDHEDWVALDRDSLEPDIYYVGEQFTGRKIIFLAGHTSTELTEGIGLNGDYIPSSTWCRGRKWRIEGDMKFRRATEDEIELVHSKRPATKIEKHPLVIGDYYRTKDDQGPFWMIFKLIDCIDKRMVRACYISEEQDFEALSEICHNDVDRQYEPACKADIDWLDRCIAADKYLERDDVSILDTLRQSPFDAILVGDTFINSAGTVCTVIGKSRSDIRAETPVGHKSYINKDAFNTRMRKGVYSGIDHKNTSTDIVYKFKPGDVVTIVEDGYGAHHREIGTRCTIKSTGKYDNKPGYSIEETHLETNSKTGEFGGMICESSFERTTSGKSPFPVEDLKEQWRKTVSSRPVVLDFSKKRPITLRIIKQKEISTPVKKVVKIKLIK